MVWHYLVCSIDLGDIDQLWFRHLPSSPDVRDENLEVNNVIFVQECIAWR